MKIFLRRKVAGYSQEKCEKSPSVSTCGQPFEIGKDIRKKKSISDLREIYEDYALLRRYLVDYQYLERDKFGKNYQKCEQHTKNYINAFFLKVRN